MPHGHEQDTLRGRLNEAETKWTSLKEKCDENGKNIARLYPLSQKYNDEALTFSVWLEKTEKKKDVMEKQPLLSNENDIKKQRKDIEVCAQICFFCIHFTTFRVTFIYRPNNSVFKNKNTFITVGE